MEFRQVVGIVLEYWWAWGVAALVLGGYVAVTENMRAKRMIRSIAKPMSRDLHGGFNSSFNDSFNKAFDETVDTATKGMGVTIIISLIAWLCLLLFVISVGINALYYFKVLQ